MNDKNKNVNALLGFAVALMGDSTEIFCNMLADKKMLYYAGKDGDNYKFHDVINDKELLLSKDEVMANL